MLAYLSLRFLQFWLPSNLLDYSVQKTERNVLRPNILCWLNAKCSLVNLSYNQGDNR
jgi:hypothetical protein